MLYKLSDSEIRNVCREKIESLEFWLRRTIDEEFTTEYGMAYIDYTDLQGNRLFKKDIAATIKNRRSNEPLRYPRDIDALLLEDAIQIVANPNLYSKHFKKMLCHSFPEGVYEAKTFLGRISAPRNNLSHANGISVRQAEQIICYSNDVIDSLKEFYKQKSMSSEFNVPLILKVTDSFGNVFHRPQMERAAFFHKNLSKESSFYLHVGDTLTIEVEIDPSFSEEQYDINWIIGHKVVGNTGQQNKLVLPITVRNVGENFQIHCQLLSKKDWHRTSSGDDFLTLSYKVLPPR